MASAIWRADRCSVPLNSRCSRKCETSPRRRSSSRDPTSTQKPTAAERTSGMRSVTSRMPLARRERRMASGKLPTPRAPTPPVAPGAASAPVAAAVTPARVGGAEVAETVLGLGLEGVLERGVLAVRVRRGAGAGRRLAGRGRGPRGLALLARRRRGLVAVAHRGERDLALGVDVVDPDGDL